MSLAPFPQESRTCWRRLDVPGLEAALLKLRSEGWSLRGALEVEDAGSKASLRYAIECDPAFVTRSARIEGVADGNPVAFVLEANDAREWTCNGARLSTLTGALDVDLSFTPATNLLPIRRLDLHIGETAPVRSAWLRFPELVLEPLEQTYTREAEHVFRYSAVVDGEPVSARLDTDEFGRVLRYENLWEVEGPLGAEPSARP